MDMAWSSDRDIMVVKPLRPLVGQPFDIPVAAIARILSIGRC